MPWERNPNTLCAIRTGHLPASHHRARRKHGGVRVGVKQARVLSQASRDAERGQNSASCLDVGPSRWRRRPSAKDQDSLNGSAAEEEIRRPAVAERVGSVVFHEAQQSCRRLECCTEGSRREREKSGAPSHSSYQR
eukprot:CAMPEP_0205820266 /NCGR_PEP_ID=MMETSP0206-20130828/2879_1 /ASSEMBLY_ACC=CAM_ASM_000279 /TAXON_ID=36767 /ORGANISM="Euplotes focardii, Strain TN1" /LENGTH=135 /DNA_ID=CAMNT_0053114799 /DNA_START=130 /DNA_END=537 /DNA_ORIENTATION=+